MKNLAVAALMCLSVSAFAGSYEEQNSKREYCSGLGMYAQMTLSAVQKGMRPPRGDRQMGYTQPLYEHIEKEIMANPAAYDGRSAHMMGWAHCMDNVGELVRRHKATQ